MGTGSRFYSFPGAFPSSNDVPVLLLNQPKVEPGRHSSLFRAVRYFLLLRLKQVDIKDSQILDQPNSGRKADRYYQTTLKFMPLVGSPGVAFIVVDEPPGSSANTVFNSVLSGWPVLVFTLLMALLSGIIMWGLVSSERVFPG